MKEFVCDTACTFGGRLFQVGDPLTVTDDTEVPKHFRKTAGPVTEEASDSGPKMTLEEALASLDHDNDEHWTKAGAPLVKAVEKLMGDTSITAADINEAAPDLKRETADDSE